MSKRPVVTRRVRIALWMALVLSSVLLADAAIDLVDSGGFGIISYICLGAACLTMVYLLTQLIIIFIRERNAAKVIATDVYQETNPSFPATSTLPSIIFTGLMALLYITVLVLCILDVVAMASFFTVIDEFMVRRFIAAGSAGLVMCMMMILFVLGLKERRSVDAENLQKVATNIQPYFVGPAVGYPQLFAGGVQPFVGSARSSMENGQSVTGKIQPHYEISPPNVELAAGNAQPFIGRAQQVTTRGSIQRFDGGSVDESVQKFAPREDRRPYF